MKISFIEIQNFRKLKSCRIEFDEQQTLLVGANNSGKTSAIDALIYFLTDKGQINTTDFTLSNWPHLERIAEGWISEDEPDAIDKSGWIPFLPTLDVWIDASLNELQYINRIIPTLDWAGGLIGVRLRYEPVDLEKLFTEYRNSKMAVEITLEGREGASLTLWPKNLQDFLDRQSKHFTIKAYLLDPVNLSEPENGIAQPQELGEDIEPLDFPPFQNIFCIDVINAQRGFSDVNTSDSPTSAKVSNLSTQLRTYFDDHLNPLDRPEPQDLDALEAIDNARSTFDTRLQTQFSGPITELQNLGYPGFSDPEITLRTNVNLIDGLNHESSVLFKLSRDLPVSLPERYNGLGYQNLISMVFKLMRFRDSWMRKGKKQKLLEDGQSFIEPIHLVIIEEPEAHLHAQVQQVFVRKAYDILRNHDLLSAERSPFCTQLVISTHSSHIAHELSFSSLRYFKRRLGNDDIKVPHSTVVSLANTFGMDDATERFATRYLSTTHSDLFFADGAILVEGPVERMMVPHFIKSHFQELTSKYITLLEIGGSHAHSLRPLIERLNIPTLVITDLDSIGPEGDHKKHRPEKGKNYRTGNTTLKAWLPVIEDLDSLLDIEEKKLISQNGLLRVAYQMQVEVKNDIILTPYTFEDSFVLENSSFFEEANFTSGLLGDFTKAVKGFKEELHKVEAQQNLGDEQKKEEYNKASEKFAQQLYDILGKNRKKAEMALELFYYTDEDDFHPQKYIANGLQWLQDTLRQEHGI